MVIKVVSIFILGDCAHRHHTVYLFFGWEEVDNNDPFAPRERKCVTSSKQCTPG